MRNDLLSDPLLSGVAMHEGYKVLGGVVLYQKLGQGGMGAVYRGRHLRLDIDVAVKVTALPPGTPAERAEDFVKRFIREARTAAAVRHPNLIRVYDANAEAGVHYLIMDYVEGESAAHRLERKERLSEQEAVEICLGAAEGLAAAHSQGIVHRDVKPDNILIDKKGNVIVADLGLAKVFGGDKGDSAFSMGISLTQQAMGTPYYMSPEQTGSAKDVGPAADVWSLGVTLYQLVSGEPPWRENDITDLINRIRNDPPPDVRRRCDGLSDGLCMLIGKALRKAPDERFTDCREMASALRDLLALIRSTTGSVLPDAEAGVTKIALVTVTPPAPETMTLIAQAALAQPSPLHDIVERLNIHYQRATYEAVAGVVGGIARGIGGRLGKKTPNNSWIVSKKTGLPTGYPADRLHPNLTDNEKVIQQCEELREWLATHAPGSPTNDTRKVPPPPAGKGGALGALPILLALGGALLFLAGAVILVLHLVAPAVPEWLLRPDACEIEPYMKQRRDVLCKQWLALDGESKLASEGRFGAAPEQPTNAGLREAYKSDIGALLLGEGFDSWKQAYLESLKGGHASARHEWERQEYGTELDGLARQSDKLTDQIERKARDRRLVTGAFGVIWGRPIYLAVGLIPCATGAFLILTGLALKRSEQRAQYPEMRRVEGG